MAGSRMLHLWEQVVGVSAKAGSVAKKYNNLAITISTLVTQAVSVGMVIRGVYRIADGTRTMGGLIGSNILVGRACLLYTSASEAGTGFPVKRM